MKKIVKRYIGAFKRKIVSKLYTDGLSTRLYMDYNKVDKSPKSHTELLNTMNRGIDALEKLGVLYSLGRGTLLGTHRDGKFTEGENDIDIDVFTDRHVYDIINILPFELLLITNSSGYYQQLVFVDPQNNVLFDIWFYKKVGSYYINKHDQGLFKIPVKQVVELSSLKFANRNYACFNPDWYCKYWYGKNWKFPVKYSKTWIQFYKEDCEGFNFKPVGNPDYVKLF